MKIVMTGGGTGGHIYPALAIADKFVQRDPKTEILYIGSEDRLEREVVPKHGFRFEYVDSMYLDRDNPLKMAKTVILNMKGVRQARKLIKEFKPDFVISTGGYVSIPVVLAASGLKVPVFIHEQNAFPGMANKFLEKNATKIFLGFKDATERFKDKSKLVYTGNPVRDDFYKVDRKRARKALEIDEHKFLIFIFGGSLGSKEINAIGIEVIKRFAENEDIHIILGTGKEQQEEVMRRVKRENGKVSNNLDIISYISYIPNVIAASDVVICRSGALSVAEINATGRAAIFVPSPNVTENHQYYNAKSVADKGGAYIVAEDDKAVDTVIKMIESMLENPFEIEDMKQNSLNCAPPVATELICNSILEEIGHE